MENLEKYSYSQLFELCETENDKAICQEVFNRMYSAQEQEKERTKQVFINLARLQESTRKMQVENKIIDSTHLGRYAWLVRNYCKLLIENKSGQLDLFEERKEHILGLIERKR